MMKGEPVSKLISLVTWLTGVLVSLAVGFGMIDGVLPIRWIPEVLTAIAGWIVVVLTIVAVILVIADKL